jgi:Protein of unknown function (DUF3465)
MTGAQVGGRLLSVAAILLLVYFFGQHSLPPQGSTPSENGVGKADQGLAAVIAARQSDVAVQGEGTVVKVLADDKRGSRHQRFLLRLASGAVVLVAHNIDLAPRLDSLRAGDELRFAGEYVWNERGGVLHWTHRDPHGHHRNGWLERAGRRYQ